MQPTPTFFQAGPYNYTILFGAALPQACNGDSNAAACQFGSNFIHSIGDAPGTLSLSNGSFFLTYANGDSFGCPAPRATVITLTCGASQGTMEYINEGPICTYNFRYTAAVVCGSLGVPVPTTTTTTITTTIGCDASDGGQRSSEVLGGEDSSSSTTSG